MWDNPDLVLYHGTTSTDAAAIRRCIKVRIGRREVDFGQGFYLTTNKQQAKEWAVRKCVRSRDVPAVLTFRAPREDLAMVEALLFVRGTVKAVDYWDFIRHCRSGGDHGRGSIGPWYDLVAGPVTRWPLEECLEDSDQLSIHTDRMAGMFNRYLLRDRDRTADGGGD